MTEIRSGIWQPLPPPSKSELPFSQIWSSYSLKKRVTVLKKGQLPFSKIQDRLNHGEHYILCLHYVNNPQSLLIILVILYHVHVFSIYSNITFCDLVRTCIIIHVSKLHTH